MHDHNHHHDHDHDRDRNRHDNGQRFSETVDPLDARAAARENWPTGSPPPQLRPHRESAESHSRASSSSSASSSSPSSSSTASSSDRQMLPPTDDALMRKVIDSSIGPLTRLQESLNCSIEQISNWIGHPFNRRQIAFVSRSTEREPRP